MIEQNEWSLTKREKDVVGLVATGLSAKEAAQELNIAPRTVERHLENCRLKFHARNRTHLVAMCLILGLVKTESRRAVAANCNGPFSPSATASHI